MHFRVFLPKIKTADSENLRRVGLGHLIPGAVFLQSAVNEVPGYVVSWRDEDLDCDVTQYDWLPAIARDGLDEGRYLVGLRQGLPPLPHELKWPRQFSGYLVPLGDGNEWCIPAAGELPQSVKMRPDGSSSRQVRREFKQYFDDSVKWFADFISRDFGELNQTFDGEIFNYLARALMLNYRLTPEVISELELFGSENLVTCLRASIDGLKIVEEIANQKKSGSPPDG